MEELLLKRVLPEMMRGILSDRDEGLENCLMVQRMYKAVASVCWKRWSFLLPERGACARNRLLPLEPSDFSIIKVSVAVLKLNAILCKRTSVFFAE